MHLRSAQSAGTVWRPSVVESSDQAASVLFFFFWLLRYRDDIKREKERAYAGRRPNPLVPWVKDEDPAPVRALRLRRRCDPLRRVGVTEEMASVCQ